jgi:uncharacterized protein YkwD
MGARLSTTNSPRRLLSAQRHSWCRRLVLAACVGLLWPLLPPGGAGPAQALGAGSSPTPWDQLMPGAAGQLTEDDVSAALTRLVNAERQNRGVPLLQLAEPLALVAQSRLGEIDERLVHHRPDGMLSPEALLRSADWGRTFENLAFVDPAATADVVFTAHQLLMSSTVHRAAILSPDFRYLGVAVGQRNGRWYIVQVFAG